MYTYITIYLYYLYLIYYFLYLINILHINNNQCRILFDLNYKTIVEQKHFNNCRYIYIIYIIYTYM